MSNFSVIISERRNDSTATVSSSQTVVAMSDTAGFVVGDVVGFRDEDSSTHFRTGQVTAMATADLEDDSSVLTVECTPNDNSFSTVVCEQDARKVHLLKLVPYEAAVLRKQASTVAFPLQSDVAGLILDMLYSIEPNQLRKANAPWPSAAGMAAPQWGESVRLFLWSRSYVAQSSSPELSKILPGSISCAIAINPTYTGITDHSHPSGLLGEEEEVDVLGTEGCFSVPGKRGTVRRFRAIMASFWDGNGVEHTIGLRDWPARVFQHECDHTEGRLYDDETAGRCLSEQLVTSE